MEVPGANDKAILGQLRLGPQTLTEIAHGLKIDDGALHLRLIQMTAEGWLTWDGLRFGITENGRAASN